MAYVIWKQTLRPIDVQEIMVPEGAEMLSAREQFDHICVWFRCDPTKQLRSRKLAIVGTGNPAPDSTGRFLGTASLSGGQFIFHVFEQCAEADPLPVYSIKQE